jgi:hypothetical protein
MNSTFLMALWNNVHMIAIVGAVVALVGATGAALAYFMARDFFKSYQHQSDADNMNQAWRVFWRCVAAAAGFAVTIAMPTSDDLWRARIDLVKLELASPESLSAGKERLDEIVAGLECKYLGQRCPKEK